jgi:flagellar assembly protein FliH
LYNKVFKNYQVNMGVPFQIRSQINFNTVSNLDIIESEEEEVSETSKEEPEKILQKANEEAQLILKEAEYEAQRIMDNAKLAADESRIKIEEEARKKGYDDGSMQSQAQYEDLIQEAEFTRQSAKMEYEQLLAEVENDTLDVILATARKVIGDEISLNKEDILYLIRQAFQKCSNREYITIKVSPEDYEFVSTSKDKLCSMVEGIGEIEIKNDPSLKEGACIVETPYGSMDAGIQVKLKKIEEAFRQALPKR